MSRSLGSAPRSAPTPLDELGSLLTSVPYHPPAVRQLDDSCTLATAIVEIDDWLHGSLTDRQTRADHASLLYDATPS